MLYAASTLLRTVEYPPRLSSFITNIDPTLPAATAKCAVDPD